MTAFEAIRNLQFWLLSQERCPRCGAPLKEASRCRKNGVFQVNCSCSEQLYFDPADNVYQLALAD